MVRFLTVLYALSIASFGQTLSPAPGPVISDQLKAFLQLTDSQVAAIRRSNADFSLFSLGKPQRSSQVQFEVAAETARSPLDPMALGLRYGELETIRRQISDESNRVRGLIAAVFTSEQRLKVAALADVLLKQPLAAEAECHNILSLPTSATFSFSEVLPVARVPVFTLLPGSCGYPGILPLPVTITPSTQK